ncbi:hypothetical protein C0995_005140 [Termitomyces sp. Mi166|nr:hypothetical protein C0995_005140 [Termitomyces sp. Mi166\
MKFSTIIGLGALIHSASAHYIWYNFITTQEQTTAAIRQPLSNSPVTDCTSNDITCNVTPSPATETVTVAAGDLVGFQLDNTLYHPGFSAIYLGQVPSGTTAAEWDGSGANWFKIAEWGATFDPSFVFIDLNWSFLNTTIPANTPPGDYLVRVESVGLHIPGSPQWYISCAQIHVTSSGTGTPTKVSIPGYVSPDDPYLMINIYYPTPTAFVIKMLFKTLLFSLLAHSVSAHYIWYNLIAGSTTSTAAVRKPVNNNPVTDVTSNDIRCNVNPTPATETVTVAAGSTIGFQLDNTIYHLGPAAIYLGKAPSTAAAWDGSGANWFKVMMLVPSRSRLSFANLEFNFQIAEWGATFNPFSFSDLNASQLTTTIPANTPPGEIGLHVVGAPQWYISCAQIKITGSGGGNPSKVSIPGYVSPTGT